jgi:hypothetical protein
MAWITRNEPWHRTGVRYCDVTGQLLPRRYWTFEFEGRTYDVMDEHCEAILPNSVAPRRASGGTVSAPPSDGG